MASSPWYAATVLILSVVGKHSPSPSGDRSFPLIQTASTVTRNASTLTLYNVTRNVVDKMEMLPFTRSLFPNLHNLYVSGECTVSYAWLNPLLVPSLKRLQITLQSGIPLASMLSNLPLNCPAVMHLSVLIMASLLFQILPLSSLDIGRICTPSMLTCTILRLSPTCHPCAISRT
jgi:hypothetical protein